MAIGFLIALLSATTWVMPPALAWGEQIPPSVRKPAEPAVAEAKREAQCKELKVILGALKKDPVWLGQPHSDREVKDLERQLALLNCADGSGVLSGTWRITGKPPAGALPMLGKMILNVVDWETGRKLGLEEWGIASSNTCRDRGTAPVPDTQTFFYYSGTIEWDKDSFFDKSYVYWTKEPSPVLICTTSPDSAQASGNFRDNRGHGGFIQLRATGSGFDGFIVPERNERGGTQDITGTRSAK